MNRKKKIICITVLFVVLVSIIGFTYAYIGTKILGNSNSKKMSFTSKKVSVTYKEISNTSSGETISPGYQYLKIFTATNTGNVEVKYHIYLDEVENNFIRVQDITYTLYRKSGNNTITSSNLSSAEVIASGTFPIINQYIKTDELLTKPNDVYTYALKINYNTSTESQDSDSGHVFGFKVQLHTSKDEIYNDKTLLSNIIKNAIGVTDTEEQAGTAKYRPTPSTNVASEISGSTEADLSQSVDDYGKTFYFRGNIKNNYVNFMGKCWRIVRIQGDGSIKLILEDQDSTCANSNGNWNIPTTTGGSTKTGKFGYTSYTANTLTATDGTTNSKALNLMNYLNDNKYGSGKSMAITFENFQTWKSYLDKLKLGDWCMNDKAYASRNDNSTPLTSQEILDRQIKGKTFYYDSWVRLREKSPREPTLKCNGTIMTEFIYRKSSMYVGTLTADEIIYAGGRTGVTNRNYYLINDNQKLNSLKFWSLSPGRFYSPDDYAFVVNYDGGVDDYEVISNYSFRPAIILKSGVMVTSGVGTSSSPYVIE